MSFDWENLEWIKLKQHLPKSKKSIQFSAAIVRSGIDAMVSTAVNSFF